jgi:hypothetical protein
VYTFRQWTERFRGRRPILGAIQFRGRRVLLARCITGAVHIPKRACYGVNWDAYARKAFFVPKVKRTLHLATLDATYVLWYYVKRTSLEMASFKVASF